MCGGLPSLAEEGRRVSLIEAGAPGAKRKRDSAQPQRVVLVKGMILLTNTTRASAAAAALPSSAEEGSSSTAPTHIDIFSQLHRTRLQLPGGGSRIQHFFQLDVIFLQRHSHCLVQRYEGLCEVHQHQNFIALGLRQVILVIKHEPER